VGEPKGAQTMSNGRQTGAGSVLVVDDDPSIREIIRLVLEKVGLDVIEAADGRAAVESARADRPDIILMDITMPEMDGYEATEQIRDTPGLGQVPIIFLTGRPPAEDNGEAFRRGGTAFMRKPFTNATLRDMITLTMMSLKE